MKTRLHFILGVAISIATLNTSAFAATVTSIQGPVQVNSGSGFHQVSGSAQVAPGGSVMASPGGSGEILYSDGCRIPVKPGSVVTVAPISPCAQGQAAPGDYGLFYYPALYPLLATGAFVGITWAIANSQTHGNPIGFVPVPASP